MLFLCYNVNSTSIYIYCIDIKVKLYNLLKLVNKISKHELTMKNTLKAFNFNIYYIIKSKVVSVHII